MQKEYWTKRAQGIPVQMWHLWVSSVILFMWTWQTDVNKNRCKTCIWYGVSNVSRHCFVIYNFKRSAEFLGFYFTYYATSTIYIWIRQHRYILLFSETNWTKWNRSHNWKLFLYLKQKYADDKQNWFDYAIRYINGFTLITKKDKLLKTCEKNSIRS